MRRPMRTRLDCYVDGIEQIEDGYEEYESNLDPLDMNRADFVDWSDIDELGLYDE